MNIRNIYWLIIVVLSGALLFEWTSEKKIEAIESHMMLVESMGQIGLGEDHVAIENEELFIVVSVENGSIIEARLKKHPVEQVVGSLGFRVFGNESAFNYYFKSGFTGSSPSYELSEAGEGYVMLVDKASGIAKTISLSDTDYEISVLDSVVGGVQGKSYAGLYRTSGRALDLKQDALSGGMMNNGSFLGVAISTDSEPYETIKLNQVDKEGGVEALSRSGWIAFVQKYFFAALLGSDENIYNFYALPSEGGLYRMGYTVESSSAGSLVYEHEHRVCIEWVIRLKAHQLVRWFMNTSIEFLSGQK